MTRTPTFGRIKLTTPHGITLEGTMLSVIKPPKERNPLEPLQWEMQYRIEKVECDYDVHRDNCWRFCEPLVEIGVRCYVTENQMKQDIPHDVEKNQPMANKRDPITQYRKRKAQWRTGRKVHQDT